MRPISISMLLVLPWLAGGAGAVPPVWICTLAADARRLICVADDDPVDVAEPVPPPAAVVNGTVFPLDPRRVYNVDLWSPATDMEFVAQLARATMCYRTPGCNVVLAGSAAGAPAAPVEVRTARRR
ncbi:MAG: hypothetical protein ABL900_03205 [Burkholderiaceae bacterium]